jgi:alpha-tubulin suppressor-like RCC1 family protein
LDHDICPREVGLSDFQSVRDYTLGQIFAASSFSTFPLAVGIGMPFRIQMGAPRFLLFLLLQFVLGSLRPLLAAPSCVPPPVGIVGWWPSEGTAADIIGTNNGSLQGGASASAPGLVGSAFRFDGTNSFVAISNSAVLRPTNFTVEAWVRFAGLNSLGSGGSPAGDQYIIFRQNSRSGDFEGFDLSKTRKGANDVFRFLVASAAGQTVELDSSTIIRTGAWYHVAAIRGSNFTQLYVNGVLERQTNVSFPQDYGNFPLYFGTSGQTYWDHKFNGELDEISIYSRALSSNEIAAIYGATNLGKCKLGITISSLPNQRSFPGGAARAVPVTVFDAENPTLSVISLNPSIVDATNLMIASSGTNFVLTITPGTNVGVAGISVMASNQNGLVATTNFNFVVGTFSDVTSNLPNAWYGSVSWADYDNDGWLDLLLSGYDTNSAPHTWLFHNEHNGGFTEVSTPFLNLADTSADWADINNDGYLDLVLQGSTDPWNGYSVFLVYRNVGGTNFVRVYDVGAFDNGSSVNCADFDNDGKADILISTGNSTVLYHNNGDGTFTNLFVLYGGKSSVIDFDNDGWKDIFLGGSYPLGTKLYRNMRTNGFADTGWSIDYFYGPRGSPGDYNNDGWPDLLLSGTDDSLRGTNLVLRNVAGALSYVPQILAPLRDGAAIWGDFDNDGKLDFFTFGLVVGGYSASKIYRNAGNDLFTDTGFNLAGCYTGGAAWGDYNNDGALDVIVTAQATIGTPLTKLYHNDGAMADTPPTAPGGLSATLIPNGVLLNWNAATDAEQAGGLTYNVRMGTNAGGVNILSPLSDVSTGFRRVPKVGNAGYRLSLLLTNLSSGNYFWSVQAIDHAFKGSTFSTEQSFSLPAPVITSQPQTQTVLAGVQVHFQVSASGAVPLAYQWAFNATNITGATNASLDLTNVQHSNTGTYAVVVTNSYGSIGSSNVALIVNTPPRILSQPQSVTAIEGTGAGFSVQAEGDAPLSYQWFFGASPVAAATNSSLDFGAVSPAEAGSYSVLITNLSGATNSVQVTLNVPASAPVIVEEPESEFVPPGLGVYAIFSVKTAGTTPFFYQWRFNGLQIAGATGSSLVLTNIQSTNAGGYSVLVSNSAGQTLSENAMLSIAPAPSSTTNLIPFTGATDFLYDDSRDTLYLVNGSADVKRYHVSSNLFLPPIPLSGSLANIDISPSGNLLAVADRTTGTNAVLDYVDLNSNSVFQKLSGYPLYVYSLAFGNDGAVVGEIGARVVRSDPSTGTTTSRNIVSTYSGPMTASADRSAIALAGPGDSAGRVFTYNVANQGIDGFIWSNDYISEPPQISRDGTLIAQPTSYGLPVFTNRHTSDYSGNYIALISAPSGVVFSPNQDLLFCGKSGSRELRGYETRNFTESFVLDFGGPVTSSRMRMSRDGTKLFGTVSSGITWVSWSNMAPSFAIQPVTQSAAAGSNATFTARVFGSPKMRYQWQRDGVSLDWETNSSLTVLLPFGTPPHAYNVIAYNPYGVVTSSNAYLTIISPPFVTSQPGNQTVGAGSNATFAVSADGSLPMYYQWRLNGTNIAGSTAPLINLTNVQSGNAGVYTVLITNIYGRTTSTLASLTIQPNPPVIIVQPQPQGGYVGTNFMLSAVAIGSEPLTYAWYTNGIALTNGGRTSGALSTNLSIANAQAADSTGYYAVITNAYGSATSALVAVSIVGMLPDFLAQPVDRIAAPGMPTTFVTSVLGTPPLSYQWKFNGTAILGATNNSLTISNIALTNYGTYAVNVSSPYGSASSTNAILARGNLAAWGGSDITFPIPLAATNLCMVSAGNNGIVTWSHVLALRSDGSVIAWGLNDRGQANVPDAATNIVAVAAGGTHSLALRANGTLMGWGDSSKEQLFFPPGLTNVVAIAAGGDLSMALRADGVVFYWGSGIGRSQITMPPMRAISSGTAHGIAMRRDGALVGWGRNNDELNAPTGPAYIPPDLRAVTAMAAGTTHNVALRSDGTVAAWGSSVAALTKVPAAVTNALAVAASHNFSLALRSDRKVSAWGSLPAGLTTGATNVPLGLSNVISIAAGAWQGFAILDEGQPVITRQPVGGITCIGRAFALSAEAQALTPISYQWRSNRVDIPGAIGPTLTLSNLTTAGEAVYQLIVSNLVNPQATVASVPVPLTVMDDPGLALLIPSNVLLTNYQGSSQVLTASVFGNGPVSYQWRLNGTSIPNGTNANLIFDPLRMTHAGIIDVQIANSATSAVASVNQRVLLLKTWGYMSNEPPTSITDVVAVAVSYGSYGYGMGHGLGIKPDGKLVAWGDTTYGQGSVPAVLSNSIITAVAAAPMHSLALRSDGRVFAWGSYSNPVRTNVPASASNVIAIACGGGHDLALRSDRTIVAWGSGSSGQTNVPSSATNVVAISGGGSHSLALRADGTVIAWGLGTSGQTNVPLFLTNIIAISAGQDHSLALRADGTLVQWGGGKLPQPTNVSNVVAIAAGYSHSTALRSDGTLATWGNYYSGTAFIPPEVANVAQIVTSGDNDLALFGVRSPGPTIQPFDRAIFRGSNTVITGKFAGTQPIAYQWLYNGNNISYATTDSLKLTDLQPVQSGAYQLIASNSYGVVASRPAKLLVILPLGEVLNATNLPWTSSGAASWFGQTNVSHDGTSAAQSGSISNNQESVLQTTYTGSGFGIGFWWKVSSEDQFDSLQFKIDGLTRSQISGDLDWEYVEFTVTNSGNHNLQWRYFKNGSGSSGLDAAWLDQVTLFQAPVISGQPQSVITNVGTSAQFIVNASVPAGGLGYQWLFNGAPTPGPNTSVLSLNNLSRSNSGVYYVIVSNGPAFTISSNALLKVIVPQKFSSAALVANGSVMFLSGDVDGGVLTTNELPALTAQASSNLVDWVTLPNVLSITNGFLLLQDEGQTNYQSRYYRIVESH